MNEILIMLANTMSAALLWSTSSYYIAKGILNLNVIWWHFLIGSWIIIAAISFYTQPQQLSDFWEYKIILAICLISGVAGLLKVNKQSKKML